VRWLYKGSEIKSHDDIPENCTDIVYQIYYTDGSSYIGKKTVRSERRLKPTKAQLAIRKNYKRVEMKNQPFVDYTGSSSENDGKIVKLKYILYMCSDKRTATYLEVRELMEHRALEVTSFNNKNISGRFFSNCLDGLI
jgi:hypothetical protein